MPTTPPPGRRAEQRVALVTRTAASTAVTGPPSAFNPGDVGQPITGAGIPAGATLSAVASGTAATLSTAATTTTTATATIGTDPQTRGFVGWSPETDTEAQAYTLASVNAGVAPPAPEQRARG